MVPQGHTGENKGGAEKKATLGIVRKNGRDILHPSGALRHQRGR